MKKFIFYLLFIFNILCCIGGMRMLANNLCVATCLGIAVSILTLYSYIKSYPAKHTPPAFPKKSK